MCTGVVGRIPRLRRNPSDTENQVNQARWLSLHQGVTRAARVCPVLGSTDEPNFGSTRARQMLIGFGPFFSMFSKRHNMHPALLVRSLLLAAHPKKGWGGGSERRTPKRSYRTVVCVPVDVRARHVQEKDAKARKKAHGLGLTEKGAAATRRGEQQGTQNTRDSLGIQPQMGRVGFVSGTFRKVRCQGFMWLHDWSSPVKPKGHGKRLRQRIVGRPRSPGSMTHSNIENSSILHIVDPSVERRLKELWCPILSIVLSFIG